MTTRPANAHECARYQALKDGSDAFQEATKQSRDFYENHCAFRDDDHYKAFDAAWKAWHAEEKAAGFVIAPAGLRVFVKPRVRTAV